MTQVQKNGGRTLKPIHAIEPHGFRAIVLDMKAAKQRRPEYLAVNPMGEVPALKHGSALVTEQEAIFLSLADLYPGAGPAPPIARVKATDPELADAQRR
jgi:glutathione S-transferase